MIRYGLSTFLGLVIMAAATQHSQAAVFYVATNGNDAWSGKLPAPNKQKTEGPFATLHRARDAMRELKRQQGGVLKEPVTVFVRGGKYLLRDRTFFLPEPLTFTPEDSGTAECPVAFTAYLNEKPVISGGRHITNWKQVKEDLWATDLPDVKAGKWYFRLLRVGDEWAIRARHPNVDDPERGNWLFAQWWGPPWEKGAFNVSPQRVHNVGDRLEWRIVAPAAGAYRVWVRYAHNMKHYNVDAMDDRTTLRVGDGEPVPLRNLPDTGGWDKYRWVQTATLNLSAGEQRLIWENVKGGGLSLDAFCLTDDADWNPETAIKVLGWWGEYQVQPPKDGKRVLLIQTEACEKAVGKEVVVPKPSLPGAHDRIVMSSFQFPLWNDWEGAEVHIFPAWGWVNAIVKVDGVDKARRALRVKCEQDIRPGNRFFIANVREALDGPREWYLDVKKGELLYRPDLWGRLKAGKGSGSLFEMLRALLPLPPVEVVAPAMDRLIVLQGDAAAKKFVEHIEFRGLTFSDSDYTAPGGYYSPADAAIWMTAARRCAVEDCTFVHVGGYAVRMEQRSHENEIVGNTMSRLGQGGVILLGDAKTQPFNNLIAANDMHDLGQIYKHVAGVYVTTGSGNRIVHNRIHRVPRYGISLKTFDGNSYSHNNLVEFNELVDTNLETNDTGAIETLGRDQKNTGNVIRYNFIRNVVGVGTTPDGQIQSPYFTWGIYLDDYSSGTTVFGNVVIGTVIGAVCIHGGKDNVVENNVFMDGVERQITLQPRDDFMAGNVFRRNIVVYRSPDAVLWYSWAHSWNPSRLSECDDNLYWHVGGLDLAKTDRAITPAGNLAKWQALGFDKNAVIADPMFVAPDKGDFRLKPDSPAFKLGFQPIPMERIGPKGFQRVHKS